MTEATDHHTEIGSDRDARLASWACICGKSEVIHFARATGEPVALRLMRIKADLHERGETETERLMEPTPMTTARPGWRCPRCDSSQWVAASLTGPVGHGGRAIKQCVPCGHYSNDPADTTGETDHA